MIDHQLEAEECADSFIQSVDDSRDDPVERAKARLALVSIFKLGLDLNTQLNGVA